MRKWLIGVAVALFALFAIAFLAPSLIDVNSYKPNITQAAKDATGRELAIDGKIALSLLPSPAVSIANLRLANLAGGSQPDMLRLQEARVAVAFWPLLSGTIKVTSVELLKPELLLEVLADGRANWQFQPAAPAGVQPTAPVASGGGSGFSLSLDDVRIEQGLLHYVDLKAGTDERIEAIDLAGSAGSLRGPFQASGSLRVRGTPLGFELRLAAVSDTQPVALSLALSQQDSGAKLDFQGTFSDPAGKAQANGKLKVQVASLAQLVRRLAGVELPAPLGQALTLDATVAGSAERLQASDLQVGLGDLKVSGSVQARLQPKPSFEVTLASNKLDLDALLASAAKSGAPAAAKPGAPQTAPGGFSIDPALTGTVKLAVEGATLNQQVVRQVQFAASVAGGQVKLDKAGALLPGGSDINLSGMLRAEAGKPVFDGRVEMAADNLRGLLNWLKVDINQVPQGRLGNLSLTSGMRAAPDQVQLTGINLRLDSSTLTGTASYMLGTARPSFAFDLSIDKFNADGYLPSAAPGKADGKPAAALQDFDAKAKLKIGQLTYNKVPIDGVLFDASLLQGKLEVRNASVQNLAGSSAALAGSFANLTGKPAIRAGASIASNDLTGLMRLVGIELPFPPARLGKSEIKATIDGEGDAIKLAGTAQLGGAVIEIGGNLAGLATTPTFDLAIDAQHRSLAALSGLFDLGLQPLAGADGPVSVKGTLKGKASALDLDLSGGLLGGTLKVAGQVGETNGKHNLKLALAATHPDAVRLLRGLGSDFRPALSNFGGLQLAANLASGPQAMELSDLKGNFGPVAFTGSATADLDRQPRPRLAAKLSTSEIVTDFFAAPSSVAPAQPGRAAAQQPAGLAERWSREPLRLEALSTLDADIELSAPRIVAGDAVLSEPRLTLQLKDGALSMPQLTGKLYEGAFEGRAQLIGHGKPQLAATMSLVGANLEQATREGQAPGKATGQFGFKLDLKGAGASQWELVNNLNGALRFNAERGVVRGSNLRQLSDRLKQLSGGLDYLDLINRAFAGGETTYSTIGAGFAIVNGVARTQDGQALLDAATANFQGVVNLVTWSLDIQGEAKLTEHPGVPAVGVRYYGSLDDPQREIKTRELEAYLLQRVGGELLRKGLGDKAGPLGGILGRGQTGGTPQPAVPQPGTTTQPATKPAQSDPKQALPGLLKDLLKR